MYSQLDSTRVFERRRSLCWTWCCAPAVLCVRSSSARHTCGASRMEYFVGRDTSLRDRLFAHGILSGDAHATVSGLRRTLDNRTHRLLFIQWKKLLQARSSEKKKIPTHGEISSHWVHAGACICVFILPTVSRRMHVYPYNQTFVCSCRSTCIGV